MPSQNTARWLRDIAVILIAIFAGWATSYLHPGPAGSDGTAGVPAPAGSQGPARPEGPQGQAGPSSTSNYLHECSWPLTNTQGVTVTYYYPCSPVPQNAYNQ